MKTINTLCENLLNDDGTTTFTLWSPSAKAVNVNIYKDSFGEKENSYKLEKDSSNFWKVTINKNLKNKFYDFEVTNSKTIIAQDPYAVAVGVNGIRAMVCDLKDTNPEGFENDKYVSLKRENDAIIMETSIADATNDKSIDIPEKYRGKFLGMAQKEYIDYVKKLGVTHIQIMPFFDFGSIDESKNDGMQYNWGYDPVNYFSLEGSYSTNPFDGNTRIKEFKELVNTLHRNNIGIIMDVVFNHTYSLGDFCFQKIEPDYFFRKTNSSYSNGSGCGNEVASEKEMVREYIIKCVCYWTKEYHIDGFRFDLMGCIDIETMNLISRELKKINPNIILYGEGWYALQCGLENKLLALKENVKQLEKIGVFSDDIRDSIKGHVFYNDSMGFVNGGNKMENDIAFSVVGAIRHYQVDYSNYSYSFNGPWNDNACKIINYVSCHDNYTLWDKLNIVYDENIKKSSKLKKINKKKLLLAQNRLSAAIVFTSQGIPFFLQGEEILRSKEMYDGDKFIGYAENSYNLSKEINSIKYNLNEEKKKMLNYYKGLIAVRKKFNQFKLITENEINKSIAFYKLNEKIVLYTIDDLIVIYNANIRSKKLNLGKILENKIIGKNLEVYVYDDKASDVPLKILKGTKCFELKIPMVSCTVIKIS
ncbi:type I pullulanase [Lachnobacterium bovis]|uniref:Pullulanase n=1 Tax=Lachnobacterium bovis TaxID=140626 RepID=A0A1H9TWB3_9FIRM|nr:type I pullulanase [Lachnobacterium bovis]SES01525.1 pullulanase [Lachnobacterium bovis]